MLHFSFWIFTYQELNDPMFAAHYKFPNISGYAVLLASLVEFGIMAKFIFYYVQSLRYNIPMELPHSIHEV